MTYQDISPKDAHAKISEDDSIQILDVRTAPELGSYHIANAQLLPVQELGNQFGELDKSASYVIYCEHGIRSLAACEILASHGFTDLTNVDGGMVAWVNANLPFEQPHRQ